MGSAAASPVRIAPKRYSGASTSCKPLAARIKSRERPSPGRRFWSEFLEKWSTGIESSGGLADDARGGRVAGDSPAMDRAELHGAMPVLATDSRTLNR